MLTYLPSRHANLFQEALAQEIWAYLNQPETKIILETTARLRHPAVEGIDEHIDEKFGARLKKDTDVFLNYKRMTGHMIRQIMSDMGYELDAQNIKTRPPNNRIFSSGSRYKKSRTSK